MDMQNYTIPFANTGETEEFSIGADPSGKVSLEKGFTELYELRPEEGGRFILRKVYNQMMKLISTDTVTWKTQSFPNWIDDKGDGLPFAYPKNALVKYIDGNTYVSKIDNNTDIPTDTNSWVNFEDFGSLNINALDEKITPDDTDNLALQEAGGLLKKVSFENLTKLNPNDQRVKTALNADGTAPIYACRAWVNFNGTGTVAIRASGNVSSITDSGTGLYTVNVIAAMPDVNYVVSCISTRFDGLSDLNSGAISSDPASNQLVSSVQIKAGAIVTNAGIDSPYVQVAIFR